MSRLNTIEKRKLAAKHLKARYKDKYAALNVVNRLIGISKDEQHAKHLYGVGVLLIQEK